MAKTLTITFNDDTKADEIRDTIIDHFADPPYADTIEDPDWEYDSENPTIPGQVPNPISRDQFFKEYVVNLLKNHYSRAKKKRMQSVEFTSVDNEDLTIS